MGYRRLKLAGATMAAPMMAPNGTRFGGWLLNTNDNDFGPVGDYDGDGTPRSSSQAPGVSAFWKLSRRLMAAPMMAPTARASAAGC